MKKAILILAAIVLLMFAEYRFIMVNLHPYYDNGILCVELFGFVDEYYVERK
jgi:hypothetical protein